MTKYREILRLRSLGLSQQNIADSCNVSKKTVNRVLKRARELDISWPLDENDIDAVLAEKLFLLQTKSHPIKGCPTMITAVRSCSATESVKNFCGLNTWRTAVLTVMSHTSSLAVLPEFSYQITAKQQLFTMVVGKTSRSMKLIRKWLNTMTQLSSLPCQDTKG